MTKLDLYNECRANIENVYQIIVSVFKEPFVELSIPSFQSIANNIPATLSEAQVWMNTSLTGTIIIHFPKVTIENEYGKTHDIYDLFVRIIVNGRGYLIGGFEIKRTSFTLVEIQKGYVHSHTLSKRSASSIQEFDHVCLGTGPIRNTMYRLNNSNNEELWLLFCNELSMYVRVESLSGGPYIKMSVLGNGNELVFKNLKTPILSRIPTSASTKRQMERLIGTILDSINLKFSYYKGRYCLGETFTDIMIKLSDFVETLYLPTIEVVFDGKSFYKHDDTLEAIPSWFTPLIGTKAFDFNGKEVRFKLIDAKEKLTPFKVIHPDYVREALNIILLLINNYYGEENTGGNNRSSSTTTEERASENKKHIKYLF